MGFFNCIRHNNFVTARKIYCLEKSLTLTPTNPMQIKIAIATAFVAIVLSSCSSSNLLVHSHTSKSLSAPDQKIAVQAAVIDTKVDFSRRVTGEASASSVKAAQEAALYDAMAKNQADFIFEPMFVSKRSGTTETVTVNGYAGKYTNMRTVIEAAKEMASADTNNLKKLMRFVVNPAGSGSNSSDGGGSMLPSFLKKK